MANARIAELEDAIKFKDDQINGQRQHIAVLSTNQSQWSETDPELLSLRRSHISRLDYLCKLKTDLSLEKSKNLTLMKREKQLKEEYANASLSMAIDCDRLREDYERERAKCQMQAREIDRLKQQLSTERERNRSEGHKTNSTIHKQSLKLLQKQLRTLNITSKKNVSPYFRANFIKLGYPQDWSFTSTSDQSSCTFSSAGKHANNFQNVFSLNNNCPS